MSTPLPLFIGGARRPSQSGIVREHTNPSQRTDVVARVPVADASEVSEAVAAAAAAFPAWRALPGPARAERLQQWGTVIAARAEELAQLIAREVGKPIGEARGEVARATVICRYYAGEAVRELGEVIPAQTPDTLQFTRRDPLGPVALITPWNFPLAIPLWKAAPALAFGNTVVLKPSELSSAVALLLAETAEQAGLPAGVFNVVPGDGTTGEALLRHPGIRAASFTGSAGVGARVVAIGAERNIRVQAEMGGKNAVLVAADADLDRAALLTAAGAMRYAGQKCTATSRVIVDRTVEGPFLDRLGAAIAALSLAPVDDAAAAIGPVITAQAQARIAAALAEHPVETIMSAPLGDDPRFAQGHWVAPRVIRLPDAAHPLAQQELFGPVLGVLSVAGIDEAVATANAIPYGLSASLFTRDIRTAFTYLQHIDVGLVRVNGDTTGVDPHAPFGGVKGSSSGGREQGRAAREFYTEIRTMQFHA